MIKCTICNDKFNHIEDLYQHLEDEHNGLIPKNFTSSQYFYFLKTGKDKGRCIICKKPTKWCNVTNKYKRFCENPKCKDIYREIFKKRMIGKYGKIHLLSNPEQQKKMLANRKISGEYIWSDGAKKTYTGSYELDLLKFLDIFLQFDSDDVMTPSPHVYYYEYEGEEKFYIPDAFIASLGLEIEVKDGGDNENKHGKIQAVDKVKERLKDKVLMSQTTFSYIKVTNKNYDSIFEFLKQAKDRYIESNGEDNRPIFVLMESFNDINNNTEVLTEKSLYKQKDIIIHPIFEWDTEESKHFIYKYSKDENFYEIKKAIKRLENFMSIVASNWNFPIGKKITYYKLPEHNYIQLTGMKGKGRAFPHELVVQSIHSSDTHEVAHIVTMFNISGIENIWKGFKISGMFWTEGIAMYYSWPRFLDEKYKNDIGWFGKYSIHDNAKLIMERGFSKLENIIYDNNEFSKLQTIVSYSIAGSFITYLLGQGQLNLILIKKIKEFIDSLPKMNSLNTMKKYFFNIFGLKIEQVEDEWINFLKNKEIEYLISESYNNVDIIIEAEYHRALRILGDNDNNEKLGPREFYNKVAFRYIYKVGNKNAGFIEVKVKRGYAFFNIFIKEEFRGKGISHALMNEGIQFCHRSKRDITSIVLNIKKTNNISIKLAKKYGFKEQKSDMVNKTHIRFIKSLDEFIKESFIEENKDEKAIDLSYDIRPDSDYDSEQLKIGIEIEQEHTKNLDKARMIAKDHLDEIPDYYTRLVKMEKEAGIEDVLKESYIDEISKINNPLELNKILNDFKYGILTKDKKILADNLSGDEFFNLYKTISPKDFYKYKVGVCWDYTEFERNIFNKKFNFKFKTYYIELKNKNSSTHTFLVYINNNKFYYFESSYKKIQGIYESNSLKDIFNFILKNMFEDEGESFKFSIYEYKIDKYNLTTIEFMNYINKNGIKINHNYTTGVKLIHINETYYNVKDSKISGKGIFANKNIDSNTKLLAIKKVNDTDNPDKDYKRTKAGQFVNHSNNPNLVLVQTIRNGKKVYFYKSKNKIKKGEELTIDYKQFDFEGERDFVKESFIITSKLAKGSFVKKDINMNNIIGETSIKKDDINNFDNYFNHSDTPNLKIVNDNGKYHLYSIKNINKGEELTINYKARIGEIIKESYDNNNLYPVFILLTFTSTNMAKVIKFVTGDVYSHVSISFDSSMNDMYSFGRKFKDSNMTFINEDIKDGLLKDVTKDTIYSLYVLFVTKEQKELMINRLEDFKKKKDKLKFSFIGLFNISIGKETDRQNEYFCSQFVAEILKASNNGMIDKHPSLYKPYDFAKHKKTHFVTRGKLENYNKDAVDKNTLTIIKQYESNIVTELYLTDLPNFNGDEDVYNFMRNNIKNSDFTILKNDDELIESQNGSSHEQAIFIRNLFNNNKIYKANCLFFIEYNEKENTGGFNHTLCYYIKNEKIYWIETSWGEQLGIHGPFNSLIHLKQYIESIHSKIESNKKYPLLVWSAVPNEIDYGLDLNSYILFCLNIKK